MKFGKPKRYEDKVLMSSFQNQTCILCPVQSVGCHVKAVGAGGPDFEWNLVPLCIKHHTEQHTVGWITFIEKYAFVASHLQVKGWYLLNGRTLWNDKLSIDNERPLNS